jgi:hypothetical protein
MIEIKTKYTKESVENYYRFIGTRNTKGFVILLFSLITMLIGVSIGIGRADGTDDMNVPIEAVLIVFGLSIFFVIMFNYVWDFRLKPKTNTKAALKGNPQLLETEICLTFYEDHFLTIFTGGLVSGTTEAKYEAVLIAYEVKDFFYLQVKQNVLLIIDKRDFTQGSPWEFTALLNKVIPKKKFKKHIK